MKRITRAALTAGHLRNAAAAALCIVAAVQVNTASAFSGDWAGTAGEFSFVTYNVAGLPRSINSSGKDPAVTTPEMGRRLLRFDVANVQEDFNYHAELYSTTTAFSYRTSTSGPVPFGSGLNTMSYMTVNGLQRIKWKRCRSEDCFSPKGFTFQRLMVGQGSYLDMYNLHAQAGSLPEDIAVRNANMQQLADYINTRSLGNAVIVAGDTNQRYTRQGENIREFLAQTGMTDAFVEAQRGGVPPAWGWDNVCPKGLETDDCEVVDRIFYRGGRDLRLQLTDYSNEDRNFLDTDGLPLSDHRPIAASFAWQEVMPKFSLVAQHSGKCVAVEKKSQRTGAAVRQTECQGDVFRGNELFRQVDDTLRVTHTGMCLDVLDGSREPGARVIQWPCWGGDNQRVTFDGDRIIFKHSGLCLNVGGASTANNAQMIQWPCSGSPNERFSRRF